MTDKNSLYGNYLQGQKWRQELHKKAAHMALDIPEEMSGVSVRRGMGWKELAVIGMAAVTGIWLVAGKMTTPAPPAPPVDDREYEVIFYDSQGEIIPVEKMGKEE